MRRPNRRDALRSVWIANLPKGPRRGDALDETLMHTHVMRRKWKMHELGGPRGWLLWTMYVDNRLAHLARSTSKSTYSDAHQKP